MPATIILVVDDEPLISHVIADALAEDGFAVLVANCGAEALAIIDENVTPIAALVTDINMGTGADGWLVARQARVLHPALPVIYTTGGAADEWLEKAVPESILVTKPFPTSEIVDAITKLLTIR